MTEGEREMGAAGEGGAQAKTAGQWLRAVRQERGLHIAALAAMLKVPQAKLEALEADRYEDLPDATFARALAKAVCRTLKVDPTAVMALLPRSDEPELHVSLGINAPYREPGQGDGLSLDWLRRPVVWALALLLLAAVGVYMLPSGWFERTVQSAATATAPAASEPLQSASAASEPLLEQAQAAESAPVAAAGPASEASVPTPVVQPATRPAALASAPASLPAPAQSVAGQLALTLRTTSPSWVEVVDATGQVLISRLLPGGSEEQLSGAAPLKVKIGNVAGTQLSVRGKPVDLAAQAKDNVARLELN